MGPIITILFLLFGTFIRGYQKEKGCPRALRGISATSCEGEGREGGGKVFLQEVRGVHFLENSEKRETLERKMALLRGGGRF